MKKNNIDFLELSPATYNALIKQHVDTPQKIANLTDKEIDRLRAIGDKRKEEVLAAREKCKEYKLDQNTERTYALIKETEKRKYLPSEIVTLMKEKGFVGFSIHKHTELWKSKDAKNNRYHYGIQIANTWYWYESWLKEVETYCEKHRANLQ